MRRRIFRRGWEYAKFRWWQRLEGAPIPDRPHFDPGSMEYFLESLSRAKLYLEYGCGGSTVEAARQHKKFISVESDSFYLKSVVKKIENEFGKVDGRFIHANIGLTEEWGWPLIKYPTWRRLQRWSNYAEAPWAFISASSTPDLILIDGRFRVHCALYSIYKMQGHDFEILIDDYADRNYYRDVEKFARLEKMLGRMAVFKPKVFDNEDIKRSIKQFARDCK
jgi:hypothetical protein